MIPDVGQMCNFVMPPCMFCDNSSGSCEHLWPDWLLKRHTLGPINTQVGTKQQIIESTPELKARTVYVMLQHTNNGRLPAQSAFTDTYPAFLTQIIMDERFALSKTENHAQANG